MSVVVGHNHNDATSVSPKLTSACESRRRWSAWRRERSEVKFERQQDALCSLSVSEKRRLFANARAQSVSSSSLNADETMVQPATDSGAFSVDRHNKIGPKESLPLRKISVPCPPPGPICELTAQNTAPKVLAPRRPNFRDRRHDLARFGTQPITIAELEQAKVEFIANETKRRPMDGDENVLHEQCVSVRDALQKLQISPATGVGRAAASRSSTATTAASTPVAASATSTDGTNQTKEEEAESCDLPLVGSLRDKLTKLNGASQDWLSRVRSENDAVQFTSEYKIRTLRSERRENNENDSSSFSSEPEPQVSSASVECVAVSEQSSANVPDSAVQLAQQSEPPTARRSRVRPRRNQGIRAQRCATVCIPEEVAAGLALAHAADCINFNESFANLSIQVDKPQEVTEQADELMSRANVAVKNALSTKLNFEEETTRWRRTRSEIRRPGKTRHDQSADAETDADTDAGSLFGTACTLKSDGDWCVLLVKGRKRPHVRLIAPASELFSGGDSYVIVTRCTVFALLGGYSSVLERARASDVAKLIAVRKELGYGNAEELNPCVIEEHELLTDSASSFWTAVNSSRHPLLEPADDDEGFESLCSRDTRVFEIEVSPDCNSQLRLRLNALPVAAAQLSNSLLDSKKALLLQFGATEIYVWFGKYFDFRLRNAALRLGSSYVRECVTVRPLFALLAKVNEGAEPTLFVQKFAEWHRRDSVLSSLPTRARSDADKSTRIARPNRKSSASVDGDERNEAPELRVDEPLVTRLVEMRYMAKPPDSSFVINCDELRRGATWIEVQDEGVVRRLHDVTTLSVTQWLVDSKAMRLSLLRSVSRDVDAMALPSNGGSFHLFDRSSYVFRWHFKLDGRILTQRGGLCWPHGELVQREPSRRESTGSRRESTGSNSFSASTPTADSSESTSGRLCTAHFLWHGAAASSQSRTAAAYLLCAVDTDKTPHFVIEQYREIPAFLRLFCSTVSPGDASLFEHHGSHNDRLRSSQSAPHLFVLRHDFPGERVFIEVDCNTDLLHPDACYLLIASHGNGNQPASVYVWETSDARISEAERRELRDYLTDLVSHLISEKAKELFNSDFASVPDVKRVSAWSEFLGCVRLLSNADSPKEDADSLCPSLIYEPNLRLRLFRFQFTSSASDVGELDFDLVELHSALRRDEYVSAGEHEARFPFTQCDLYDVNEQADRVLLIDAYQRVVFLWFAEHGSPTSKVKAPVVENDTLSSAADSFWNEHLRVAVQTALAYCNRLMKTKRDKVNSYLLFSGSEPAAFRSLFPFWSHQTDAADRDSRLLSVKMKAASTESGRFALDLQLANELLFNRRFSLAELRERSDENGCEKEEGKLANLPMRIGVDARYLEAYLTQADFESAFRMTREQFYALPRWRQIMLKKDLNLL